MVTTEIGTEFWWVLIAVTVGAICVGWVLAIFSARRLISTLFTTSLTEITKIPLHIRPFLKPIQQILLLKRERDDHAERYRILTDNIAAGIIIHDSHGKISWCSPFMEVLTGHSLHEILSNSENFLTTLAHDDDRDLLKRALAVAGIGEPFQFRFKYYHKSGLLMWADTRTVPIFDDNTNQYMALSILFDVTSEVLYRQNIEERSKDLHDFTYMISHDLKAPLSTIKGMASVLEEETHSILPEIAHEALNHIQRATVRLDGLVSGILELAQVSVADRSQEPVNVRDVIKDATMDLASAVQEHGVTLVVGEDLPTVLGDRNHFYRIFSNLISNAIKYRDHSRPLNISISAEPGTSRRQTKIIVSDNGLGIDPQQLDSIFRPFKRIYVGDTEGTGVGLACVQKLTERLSGKVSVTSVLGEGSKFILELRRGDTET